MDASATYKVSRFKLKSENFFQSEFVYTIVHHLRSRPTFHCTRLPSGVITPWDGSARDESAVSPRMRPCGGWRAGTPQDGARAARKDPDAPSGRVQARTAPRPHERIDPA